MSLWKQGLSTEVVFNYNESTRNIIFFIQLKRTGLCCVYTFYELPSRSSTGSYERPSDSKAGKTWRLNFPVRFDGPFVEAVKSIGLIQRIPRCCLEEEEEWRGMEEGETIRDGRQEVVRVEGCWKNGQVSQARRQHRRMSNSPYSSSWNRSISLSLVRARLRPIRNHIKSVSMRPVKTPI